MTNTTMLSKKLKTSQQVYYNIFENSHEAIFIFEPEKGIILDSNKKACLEYGLKKTALIGRSFYSLWDESETLIEKSKQLLEGVEVPIFELQLFNSNGTSKIFEIDLSQTDYFELKAIVAITHNITDKKIAEKKLSVLTEAVRQSSVAVLLTDRFRKIEYANCKYLQLRGKSLSEVLGYHESDLDIPNFNEVQKIWQNLKPETGWSGEITSTKSDGSKYYATLSISPIRDNRENITHFLAIEQEITNQKELENQLKIALNELKEKNDFKTTLLGNLNHEIRTPMNSIIGFSQIIGEESENTNIKEMSNKIIKAGQRLLNTLSSIIELSDLESEKIKVKKTDINVSHLLRSLGYSFSRVANEKNLELKVELLKEDMIVFSDERLLEQILKNFIENAIKFTEKGNVKILADQININDEHFCIIKVIDTGIGIPEINLAKIFDAFKQLSEGTTRRFEGTGLGLTIVKKASKLINAKLNIESKMGEGSTFSLILPLQYQVEEQYNEDAFPLNSKIKLLDNQNSIPNILIVEDDLMNIDIMKYFLNEFALMDNAINGKQALEAVTKNKYDVILMDINLKGEMDGIELMKLIRKMPEHKNIPIIAISGYTSSEDQDKFLTEGFTQFLAKPYNRKQLTEILLKVLR